MGQPVWRSGRRPQPPNPMRRAEQATARRLNHGANTSAGHDRTPSSRLAEPDVVEVPVRPSTIQYEHRHGWVDDSQQLDETSLTSRFFVSTSSIWRTDRRRHDREAHHRCQDLATPSITLRREVQTLATIGKHRAERPGHGAEIVRRHLDHRQSVPTVGPDALVDEPMGHRHLMTSSPAAAAAASACWPGMTWP